MVRPRTSRCAQEYGSRVGWGLYESNNVTSRCPGVMIENARKDACTECSICQSPRYAK